MGSDLENFPRTGDRYYTENLKALFASGVDPVASVIRMCHSIGLECHLSIRPQGFALEPPFDAFFKSPFYRANPGLRCVDRDGRRIARLSFAYPEVREHLFAIVDELVSYQPDGINLIYCRGIPCVLYEEPFLREFRSRHGQDPRKLPEDHADVLALRADIMGNFMQELRRRTQVAQGGRRSPPSFWRMKLPTACMDWTSFAGSRNDGWTRFRHRCTPPTEVKRSRNALIWPSPAAKAGVAWWSTCCSEA